MRFVVNQESHWLLGFVIKILRWIVVLNLIVFTVLWGLNSLHLFTPALMYEAAFLVILGVFQILGTYVYRKDSIPSRWGGSRTGWFDFKKFAELTPEERQRYRQEGRIMIIIGFILLVVTITTHFFIYL